MLHEEKENKAQEIVDNLGIFVNPEDGVPVQAMLIVRTLHPNGEVGIQFGVSDTATWFDNLALITASKKIIDTNVELFMEAQQINSYLDDEDTNED